MKDSKYVEWHQTPFTGMMLVKLLSAHTTQLWARQTYSLENDGVSHVI